ncbi:hypothetical protein Bbelb_012220 [Branchiostoma belcheri]|nr:hypothetical protein Bbelb_012220 [Branchiostoma belcheri]
MVLDTTCRKNPHKKILEDFVLKKSSSACSAGCLYGGPCQRHAANILYHMVAPGACRNGRSSTTAGVTLIPVPTTLACPAYPFVEICAEDGEGLTQTGPLTVKMRRRFG